MKGGGDAAACPQRCAEPDVCAPLALAVGELGDAYWEWVHRPAPGSARFFSSDVLEALTRCPWWLVPVLWLPIWMGTSAVALARLHPPAARGGGGGAAALQLAALQLAGAALWQALEYGLHRCVFHARAASRWGITAHFLLHGNHHKFPGDASRLVFPPLPAAAIAGALYRCLSAALPPPAAAGVMAGVIAGYVAYDLLHYALHHASPRGPLRWRPLRELRARHAHHHFRQPHAGYGISCSLLDAALGTAADLRDA